MVFEENTEGLNPSEVSRPASRTNADEMSVYLEVMIGDKDEVVVGFAVEVKHYAVSTYKSWIVACCSIALAIRLSCCIFVMQNQYKCIYQCLLQYQQ